MDDVVLGLVALIAGSVFCFSGYRAFRVVIPIWGLFSGFAAGAGLVSAITGDALLAKPVGWVAGVVLGLVFAVFAYLYYEVAVVLTMASVGFLVGASAMTALGVTWNWIISLVAVLVSLAFAVVAISTNMPRILLTVVSAVAGATAMVGGAMLLGNSLDADELNRANITSVINDSWGWWLAYVVLAVAGIGAQAAGNAREDAVRAAWARSAA